MAARIGTSPALTAMRRPVQPRRQPTPAAQSPLANSPALTAMGGRPQMPSAPSTPQRTPARTDIYNPTQVDTSASEAAYSEALASNQGMIDEQRKYGENYLNALQRRNGSNAALTGMSIGGGSYMGGQRAAFTTGINALNQSLLPLQQNATNILSSKAGTLANAAGANTGAANIAKQFNAGRESTIQDRAADEQATWEANAVTGDITAWKTDAGWYVDGGANGSFGANGLNAIENQWMQAQTPEEKAAAKQAAENYKNALAQARMDYDGRSDAAWGMSFDEWKKKFASKYGIS